MQCNIQNDVQVEGMVFFFFLFFLFFFIAFPVFSPSRATLRRQITTIYLKIETDFQQTNSTNDHGSLDKQYSFSALFRPPRPFRITLSEAIEWEGYGLDITDLAR